MMKYDEMRADLAEITQRLKQIIHAKYGVNVDDDRDYEMFMKGFTTGYDEKSGEVLRIISPVLNAFPELEKGPI